MFFSLQVPEQEQDENLERLRNIRDMFENSGNDSTNELILQKVEKLQPSEKIKERFTKSVQNAFSNIHFLKDVDYGQGKKYRYSHA